MPFDGETVRIRVYMIRHTDGDLSVYFEKADVLFTGDTWWNGALSLHRLCRRRPINGMIKAADANLAMVTDHTIIVPGHGPVGDRMQLLGIPATCWSRSATKSRGVEERRQDARPGDRGQADRVLRRQMGQGDHQPDTVHHTGLSRRLSVRAYRPGAMRR